MASKDCDPDLEFWLLQADSTMGHRGTLAAVQNALESGGVGGGNLGEDGLYVHPYTDLQLGTGKCIGRGDIERARWLARAWFACSERTRLLLQLAHLAPPSELRSDSGYGARDRWVKGSDHREGQHRPIRTGVDAELGNPVDVSASGVVFGNAAVAIFLTPDTEQGKLLLACCEPNPVHGSGKLRGKINRDEQARRRKLVKDAKRRAQEALAPAWNEWFESKENADPMRLDRQRRAVLPATFGLEAGE